MQEQHSFQHQLQDESIHLREQLEKYLKYWRWFALSVFIALLVAFIYLRYAQPQYRATATILVKDDRKGSLSSEMSAFNDLGLMNVKSNVDNEIEVIKSRSIVEAAVRKLNFNVAFYTEARVKTIELYDSKPFDISFFEVNKNFYEKNKTYLIDNKKGNTFELKTFDNKNIGVYKYGETIQLADAKMVITKRPQLPENKFDNYPVTLQIRSVEQVAQSYKSRISVEPISKTTSVVTLTLTDEIPQKAADFLNAMVEIYNQDAIDDKNFISKNTQEFIDERLKYITKELGDVEKAGESFLKENRLTNIETDAQTLVQNSVSFEKELIQAETQVKVVNSLIDYLNDSPKDGIIPNNIVPAMDNQNSNATATLINEYNSLINQRNRNLNNGGTDKNLTIINLNNKIDDMRISIKESLNRLLESLKIKRNDLRIQDNLINSKISSIPSQGREFKIIDRQQKIKEALYLYLLQKREEVGITLAVTAPNAKIIDAASASKFPVSPKRSIIWIAALMAGLLIPFLIIFIRDLLDTKIKNRKDVEEVVTIPFLGDIPASESSDQIIEVASRSSSAEAVRMIRTNLDFILGNVAENQCKTIFVTSSIPKEGKTFISINLAATIALTAKKVLIIGMDIRNPKLNNYITIPTNGLTNYLAKNDQDIHDYIVKVDKFDNLYALPSGVIPPNPVELLSSNKINELFTALKKEYDYIIVDTPPVSLVTDTLLVAKHADAFVYVIRANYLDKRMLGFIEDLYQQKKLPNLSLILNDTDLKKSYGYAYGYGYGYGVEPEVKTLKEKLFRKK
ncbi:GumC family protein [Flavobacterium solisilvae]|uniref:non-specific protein-tyrosine kinase n=1 Tax=Flavobacterium solisilvae TaxID=1852019 RepID=A0ABX1QVH2_9FLAO|nr:polysaccharide biosynthesis tyrosine autokinase [Flavobacterium solisilvae]NMH25338.1 polysaccharide biosynthesis tyrosine autokinase [Flavobacterium solisilvae]